MTKKDKEEIINLFNEGITQLILPVLDEMNNKMATKDDIQDLQTQLDSIERKVEANQSRSDDQGKDIDKIKRQFSFA